MFLHRNSDRPGHLPDVEIRYDASPTRLPEVPIMATYTLCRTDELPVGQRRAFGVGGEKLLLFHLADGYYATQTHCTHMFAPLAKGKILEECQLQCPFHRARFDIRTGKVIEWANWPPVNVLNAVRHEKPLKTWPVKVAGNQVQVEIG